MLASAYALAAREAADLAVDLSRRAEKLFDAVPKLRAKGAERVIEMLLADDCVGPARAANKPSFPTAVRGVCSIGSLN
ncbi:DUF1403 family protein [Methylocystis sp. H62]|uniref:DUF1403 family protein n=1 Tax=Methylocystis sp. H62 TaxID=2785789 RepID=UPI00391723A3